jgi:hypothetical protein
MALLTIQQFSEEVRFEQQEVLAMIKRKAWKRRLESYWEDLLQDDPKYFATQIMKRSRPTGQCVLDDQIWAP